MGSSSTESPLPFFLFLFSFMIDRLSSGAFHSFSRRNIHSHRLVHLWRGWSTFIRGGMSCNSSDDCCVYCCFCSRRPLCEVKKFSSLRLYFFGFLLRLFGSD